MNILHVVSSLAPRLGGPSKAALDMCVALQKLGAGAELFTTNLDGQGTLHPFSRPRVLEVPTGQAMDYEGARVTFFDVDWPSRYACSWAMARELKQRISEFDLVHIHSLYLFPSLIAARYARQRGVPYIVRPHGTLDPFLRRHNRVLKAIYNIIIERNNLDHAAAIHYTTEDEMRLAESVGIAAPGIVVPLGVNVSEFAQMPPRGSFRQRFPELQDKLLLLFLGRLAPKKGLDLLAKAFGTVARQCPEAHLILAGPDDEGFGARVTRWLSEEGVLDRASFTGLVLGEEKLSILSDADLWVLPSYTENFGLAVVEAMACGLPVIVTDRVNIHQAIRRAHAGLVIEPSAAQLADAILRLARDETLRQEMGVAGRELVSAEYSWDIAARRMLAAYHEVLGWHRKLTRPPLPRLTRIP